MDELLFEYIDKFNENFPMFKFMGVSKKEVEKIIKKCIEENKPYEDKDTNKIY